MSNRVVAFACLVLLLATPAGASQLIRCERPNAEPITITRNAERKFGASLNCIKGNFIGDMTPCAPNGGFGLSRPTGLADLTAVVWRWQDYGDLLGGVVDRHVSADAIHFNGGFYGGHSDWSDQWSFAVDRVTGVGILRLQQEGAASVELKPAGRYVCRYVGARF